MRAEEVQGGWFRGVEDGYSFDGGCEVRGRRRDEYARGVVVPGGHDETSDVSLRERVESLVVEDLAHLRVHLEAQAEDEPVVGERDERGLVVAERAGLGARNHHRAPVGVAAPHGGETMGVGGGFVGGRRRVS